MLDPEHLVPAPGPVKAELGPVGPGRERVLHLVAVAEQLLGGDDRLEHRLGDAGDASQRVLDPGLLGRELGVVGEVLEAAAAAGRVVGARSLDALRPGLEHLGRDRLGVTPLHLGHARPDPVARKAGAHEDDEPVEPRDPVAAECERVDPELELLVALHRRSHHVSLDGCAQPAAERPPEVPAEQPAQNRHTSVSPSRVELISRAEGASPPWAGVARVARLPRGVFAGR